jgi:outer membrane cobalamin receptor
MVRQHRSDSVARSTPTCASRERPRKLSCVTSVYDIKKHIRQASIFIFCFIFIANTPAQTDTALTTPVIHIIDNPYQKHEGTTITLIADSLGNYQNNGLQLQDALIHINSVYIRNYGAHSGIKTFSLRGLASNQTNLIIAGIPVQSAQQGSFNLANFSLDDFDVITLTQGSSDINTNTLSGNLQLDFTQPKYKCRLKTGLGSFQNYFTHISLPLYKKESSFLRVNARYEQAKDNYPYRFQNKTFYRENAQFKQHQANAVWQKHTKKWKYTLFSKYYANDNGVPDAIVFNNPVSTQKKLREWDTWTMFKMQYMHQKWVHEANIAYHTNFLQYYTPLANFEYFNHDAILQYQTGVSCKKHYFKANIQGMYAHLSGDNLAIRLQKIPFVDRKQFNVSLADVWSWHRNSSYFYYGTIQGAYRANITSDFSPNHNVSAYSNIFIYKKHYLYANLTYTTRIPSFNEMYYFGYGNPDILPERTQNTQFGYSSAVDFLGRVLYKGEVFYHVIYNKIVSVPQNPVIWSTYSVGKVISKGFEVDMQYQPHQNISLHYGYTRTDARDALTNEILPYTPVEMIKSQIQYSIRGIYIFQASYQYNGFRFSSLQNDKMSYLPPYHILDMSATCRLRYQKHVFQLKTEINNALNTQYEIIRGYIMPRRTYLCTFMYVL